MKVHYALSIKIAVLILISQLNMSCFSYRPLVKNQSSKSMDEVVTKISINTLHRIKLKTGITVKMKIERVDEKSIYGTLFQKSISGVEHRYENDSILISNIDDIKVRKLKTVTTFAIVIPISVIAIAIAVTPGAAQAIRIH